MNADLNPGNTLLLVEDDDNHAEIFTFHATAHEPEIRIVRMSDGGEVMQFLEANQTPNPEFPRLIVFDLNLPRFSGLEVLRAIKKHPIARRVPTVVFSSSCAAEDISEAWENGVNSYLCKPVLTGDFKPLIKMALDYWNANQADKAVFAMP